MSQAAIPSVTCVNAQCFLGEEKAIGVSCVPVCIYSAHLVWECAHPDCGGWCHWQPRTCKLRSHSAGGDAGRAKCCSLFPPLLAFHCPICDEQETETFRHTKTHLQQPSCDVTMHRCNFIWNIWQVEMFWSKRYLRSKANTGLQLLISHLAILCLLSRLLKLQLKCFKQILC